MPAQLLAALPDCVALIALGFLAYVGKLDAPNVSYLMLAILAGRLNPRAWSDVRSPGTHPPTPSPSAPGAAQSAPAAPEPPRPPPPPPSGLATFLGAALDAARWLTAHDHAANATPEADAAPRRAAA